MTNKRKEEIERLTIELLKEFNLYRCNGAGPIFVKDELKKFFNFSFREADLESDFLGAIFKGKKEVKIVVNSKIDNTGRKNFMKIIQMWLGHSNMSTTADIYAHLDVNAKKEASKAIESLLDFNNNED